MKKKPANYHAMVRHIVCGKQTELARPGMVMKSIVARYCVSRLMTQAERIFFIYGMRRSGNHACVRWLANALEAESAVLREGEVRDNFYGSITGNTVFLNNITDMTGRAYIKLLNKHREELGRARFVLISVEDEDPSYRSRWRIPRRSENISVRRGTLNIMASRFQSLNNLAHAGCGSRGYAMEARFYAVLESIISAQRVSIWEFERWSSDGKWRQEFLEKLGLNRDIPPEMSGEGGGSSFSGTQIRPSTDQLKRRFATVEPRRPWIEFIQKAAREHPEVFRQDELDVIFAVAGDCVDTQRRNVPTHRPDESNQHPGLGDQLIC